MSHVSLSTRYEDVNVHIGSDMALLLQSDFDCEVENLKDWLEFVFLVSSKRHRRLVLVQQGSSRGQSMPLNDPLFRCNQ